MFYLGAIDNSTFIFEGMDTPSNIEPVRELRSSCENSLVHFYQVPGSNHFSGLAPVTPVIAAKIRPVD